MQGCGVGILEPGSEFHKFFPSWSRSRGHKNFVALLGVGVEKKTGWSRGHGVT